MSFETIRTITRSIRFRLVFWNTALAFLLFMVSLLLVRYGVQTTRYQFMDEFLDEEMQEIIEEINSQEGNLKIIDTRAARYPRRLLFVQLLDANGGVIWSSVHSPEPGMVRVAMTRITKAVAVDDFYFRQESFHLPNTNASFLRVGMSL